MAFFQKTINLTKALIYIGGTLAVAGVSAFLGRADLDGLTKPPLTPPGWLFPVVWTILYLLMGYAAYRVSLRPNTQNAIRVYWIQLFFNALWSIAFFTFEWRLFAFFWLLALLVLIVRTIAAFRAADEVAGNLLIPYLLWCGFATYLNLGFYLLNR